MRFAILDRPRRTEASSLSGPIWQTCLREVTFSNDAGAAWSAEPDMLKDGAAYTRVLEIICGLRSPLVGETQVLGQFKTFLASLDPGEGWLSTLGQRLLTDARAIRSRHLRGLGSRTYGSVVRRHIDGCPTVVLVGAGALADELLPFLSEHRQIEQWTRRPAASRGADAVVTNRFIPAWTEVDVNRSRPVSFVVAAPMANDDLLRIASRYTGIVCVIDLRGEAAQPLTVDGARSITLADIFAAMASDQLASAERVRAAKADVLACSRDFDRAEVLRPFGWEDLCA